jgi:drug/metabolite transporter (DMT)-like permease
MSYFANRKALGIAVAVASYAMFSLHYATMKWLGGEFMLWQLIFARSAGMLVITLVLGRTATIKAFAASPYKLSTALRAVLQFSSALCFYVAAGFMPLANVTTLYSTAPLIIVLLSMFLLGESIRALQWAAILVGLVGTVIATDPGHGARIMPSLVALGSGLFWALTFVFTRKSGARESSDVQMLNTSIVFLVLSVGFMRWKAPSDLYQWGVLIGLGLQIYLAQLLFFESCRFAPASLIGPLEYTSVAWACLFGFLIFAEIPTTLVVIGSILVIISGIAITVSAHRVSQTKPEQALKVGDVSDT